MDFAFLLLVKPAKLTTLSIHIKSINALTDKVNLASSTIH